jgi:hypothetical protein
MSGQVCEQLRENDSDSRRPVTEVGKQPPSLVDLEGAVQCGAKGAEVVVDCLGREAEVIRVAGVLV